MLLNENNFLYFLILFVLLYDFNYFYFLGKSLVFFSYYLTWGKSSNGFVVYTCYWLFWFSNYFFYTVIDSEFYSILKLA